MKLKNISVQVGGFHDHWLRNGTDTSAVLIAAVTKYHYDFICLMDGEFGDRAKRIKNQLEMWIPGFHAYIGMEKMYGWGHPHEELHHIKKENIGLIEVMGLAILPGRLKKEMADLKAALLNGEDLRANDELAKHADWADGFMKRHPKFNADNAEEIIQFEIGQVFAKVLECAGVYKCTAEGREHLKKFLTEVQNG